MKFRNIHSFVSVENKSLDMNFVSEEKELVQTYLPLTTNVSHLGYLMNEQGNKKGDRQTTPYSTRNKSVALDFHIIFEIIKKCNIW